MTIYDPERFAITAFKIIDVESQFTKAIFSVSIIFTDACQRTALQSTYEILSNACGSIKIRSLTFFLLQICRVVGVLIEPHYGSHVRYHLS
jgi:hypothetical protein